MGDVREIITDANFWDDRFCMARDQILGFSIGFRHHPYNKGGKGRGKEGEEGRGGKKRGRKG